jgi:hypothetical protein
MLDEPMTTDEATPSTEDEDTIGSTVPWFFQEDDEPALRSQAGWTERHLGLSDDFYARFLKVPESSFRDWKPGRGELPADQQDAMRRFWYTVLLLLDFAQMDVPGAKAFLERLIRVENTDLWTDPYTPPWNGTCLKTYLEIGGPDVLQDVNRYLASFGAGNPMFS